MNNLRRGEILASLKALRKLVVDAQALPPELNDLKIEEGTTVPILFRKFIKFTQKKSYDSSVYHNIYNKYGAAADELKSECPKLFDKLLAIPSEGITQSNLYIYLDLVVKDIDYAINILLELPVDENVPININREGIFVSGQYFDALALICDLLKEADESIVLIDGYISKKVLEIMTCKKTESVEVMILTKKSSVTTELKALINDFDKQYRNIRVNISESFHDRFVILDKSNFYHIGSSIKDAGHKVFMFSRIEEPEIKDVLLKKWETEWEESESAS